MLVEDRPVVAAVPKLRFELALAVLRDPPLVDQGAVRGPALAGIGRGLARDPRGRFDLLAILLRDLCQATAGCALHVRLARHGHRLRKLVAAVIGPFPALAFTNPDRGEIAE